MASIETQKDLGRGLTFNIVKGSVSYEDILNWVVDYYAGAVTKFILWDFSQVKFTDISSDQIIALVKEVRAISGGRAGGKTALVVPEDLGFGLGRMVEAFSEFEGLKFDYMAFRSIEEAKKWLGVLEGIVPCFHSHD